MDSANTLGMDSRSQIDGEAAPAESAGAPSVTREQIEGWLTARIAQLTSVEADAVAVDRPFADFALDSALIISVTLELSRWLGRELSVTLFWEYPTIEDLAQNLVSA